jgi:hypothetical protein
MAGDKPEVVVSYKDGVESKRPLEVGEMTFDEVQAAERARVHGLRDRVLEYIREDRAEVWEELTSRQEAQIRQAQRSSGELTPQLGMLPDAVAQIAGELFAMWKERDDRNVTGLSLYSGVCIQFPHAWFQIEADPMRIADMKYIYLIDPAPRGLELEAPYLVVPPLSAFQLCYAGRPLEKVE